MNKYTEIAAALALTAFSGQTIAVQVAKEVEKEVDGKKRKVFETEKQPLSAEHVISAKQWTNGRVTITTVDGQKHEARGTIRTEPADKKAEQKK